MTAPLDTAALLALVAEVRARADAATPGWWAWDNDLRNLGAKDGERAIAVIEDGILVSERDAPLIAHARDDVRALCAAVEALVAERDAMRDMLDRIACIDGVEFDARCEENVADGVEGLADHAQEMEADRDRYRRLLARAAAMYGDDDLRNAVFSCASWPDIEKIARGEP